MLVVNSAIGNFTVGRFWSYSSVYIDQFPELVKTALSSACKSGRSLSWKVQENSKGMLIQLVWKAEPVNGPTSGNTTMVGSNWKLALTGKAK